MPPKPQSYDAYAEKKARQYGIPVPIFLALGGRESGRSQYRPGGAVVTSSAGARGWGQLMPDTAKGLGVNPDDPFQNIDGAARYLKENFDRFGDWRRALAAYYAGPTRVAKFGGVPPIAEDYVDGVLTAAAGFGKKSGKGSASEPVPFGSQPTMPAPPDLTGLLLSNLTKPRGERPSPRDQLGELAMAVAQAPAPAPPPTGTPTPTQPSGGDPSEWVKTPKWAGGPSPPPGQKILGVVARLAQMHGEPLEVWDTTRHSKSTVNGTPSKHGVGEALDIPASGARLRQLGYLALVMAGMNKKDALAASKKGGLFNVGGLQIIFATKTGGNHYDHLHVGLRG